MPSPDELTSLPWDQHFDEEFRCQARSSMTGNRCRKRCLRGHRFCKSHIRNSRASTAFSGYFGRMPSFYKKHLSKAVADLVEEAMQVSPEDQVSLYDELALMRALNARAVNMWSIAHELPDDNVKKPALLDAASELMAQALERYARMSEQAQRIRASAKDKFSIHNLNAVIQQITIIAHKVLGEHPELAREFEREMRESITLPTTGDEGSDRLPGEDETDMDETIGGAEDV